MISPKKYRDAVSVLPTSAVLLRQFYDRLVEAYGPQLWWPARTAIEVVVGAYLTQNTSWRGVEHSIHNLRQARFLSVKGLRAISPSDMQVLIRPSGYMVRKSAAIKAFIDLLDREYRGSLTRMAKAPTLVLREQLLALPGVGPETADAILLYALNHAVIVVDEYLRRILARHQLSTEKPRYAEIQSLALAAFAQDSEETRAQHYNEFHALVVEVGKRHCGPRPRCQGCPLNQPEFNPPTLSIQNVLSATSRRASERLSSNNNLHE